MQVESSETPILSPRVLREDATARIAQWCSLMDLCEQMLLANLSRTCKTEEELKAAYKEWREKNRELKDREIFGRRERRGLVEGGDGR